MFKFFKLPVMFISWFVTGMSIATTSLGKVILHLPVIAFAVTFIILVFQIGLEISKSGQHVLLGWGIVWTVILGIVLFIAGIGSELIAAFTAVKQGKEKAVETQLSQEETVRLPLLTLAFALGDIVAYIFLVWFLPQWHTTPTTGGTTSSYSASAGTDTGSKIKDRAAAIGEKVRASGSVAEMIKSLSAEHLGVLFFGSLLIAGLLWETSKGFGKFVAILIMVGVVWLIVQYNSVDELKTKLTGRAASAGSETTPRD